MSSGFDGNLDGMGGCICFNLRRASRAVTQYYESRVDAGGLRATQSPVLTALAVKPRWAMTELSEALGMERTTLLRNLGPLRRRGLVSSSSGRGRAADISITPKGRRELSRLKPSWARAQKRVAAVLGERRWAEILSDLRRASEVLKEDLPV